LVGLYYLFILQLYDDRELTASLEIIIVESLHSTAPLLPSNLVLLAPGATFQLDTNRNSGKTTFRSVPPVLLDHFALKQRWAK
jgi:hypothetical protein